jgi:Domain of unknown function (DUF6894)
MTRYFFDVANKSYVQYDYRGREFERPEQAREMAELIALDVECTEGDDLARAEVQVRNVNGVRLFSVPIREPERIAA